MCHLFFWKNSHDDVLGGSISTETTTLIPLTVGFISAFVTGLFACKWMIKLVKKSKLKYFAYYCFVLGTIACFWNWFNMEQSNLLEGSILLIDNPTLDFFDVVKKHATFYKRISSKKIKVGHAGTLDPLASGLLVVCTGKFTKRINEFQAQRKNIQVPLRWAVLPRRTI